MPYKDPQKTKEYYEKNKEKIKERRREHYEENKEEVLKRQKEYKEKNKEELKEKRKEYRERNKEELKEKRRERYTREREEVLKTKRTDPQHIKSSRISKWKRRGVIGDLDKLYEYYLSVPKCEACDVIFEDTFYRCLDHDHETGVFRKVVCRSCNTRDSYIKN